MCNMQCRYPHLVVFNVSIQCAVGVKIGVYVPIYTLYFILYTLYSPRDEGVHVPIYQVKGAGGH